MKRIIPVLAFFAIILSFPVNAHDQSGLDSLENTNNTANEDYKEVDESNSTVSRDWGNDEKYKMEYRLNNAISEIKKSTGVGSGRLPDARNLYPTYKFTDDLSEKAALDRRFKELQRQNQQWIREHSGQAIHLSTENSQTMNRNFKDETKRQLEKLKKSGEIKKSREQKKDERHEFRYFIFFLCVILSPLIRYLFLNDDKNNK